MAAPISEFIADLETALAFESERIKGYEAFLLMPDYLIDAEGKREIREGLDWSNERRSRIKNTLTQCQSLQDHKYPQRFQQVAADLVIKGFYETLRLMQLSAGEFMPPPTLVGTVSEEMDANIQVVAIKGSVGKK